MFHFAISKLPAPRMPRAQEVPIPGVPEEVLARCRDAQGKEVRVAVMESNTRAYHVRRKLEAAGYRCRCQKLGEGRHAVYAVWPGEERILSAWP